MAAAPGDAQSGASPPSAGPEYDVYVTGDEGVAERVATTRVVDAERIEERSARTLDDALQLEPGVYVRTGGDATPRIDVRGLRSRHVLLLLDGIPFNSTEDGQFDPAWIPTELMEEVKVRVHVPGHVALPTLSTLVLARFAAPGVPAASGVAASAGLLGAVAGFTRFVPALLVGAWAGPSFAAVVAHAALAALPHAAFGPLGAAFAPAVLWVRGRRRGR